jgi:shikimate kinase
MKNIILIGMPGAGKSTVGVILAKVLGYNFVDSDIVIQQNEKRTLREIIQEEGADGFVEIENRVHAKMEFSNSVIATGGSVVYGQEAMAHLKEIGTIIYLKLSYNTISHRLHDIKNRGVVLKDGQTLRTLYDERTLLYEEYADVVVKEDGLSVEETIEKVLQVCKTLEM